MLIRSFVILMLVAFPLSMSAVSFDLSQFTGGATALAKLDLSESDPFESHWRWRRHRHWRPITKKKKSKKDRPGKPVPEPTAALLFGLGAVVVGAGIRRRR